MWPIEPREKGWFASASNALACTPNARLRHYPPDGSTTIASKDGVRVVMHHASQVFGCAFDPFQPDLLATATVVRAGGRWADG